MSNNEAEDVNGLAKEDRQNELQSSNSEINEDKMVEHPKVRPSIWKELESMGEVPPEHSEHSRRNFRHNRRRGEERNDVPKLGTNVNEFTPRKEMDPSRIERQDRRRQTDYDSSVYKHNRDRGPTSPDNCPSDDWSSSSNRGNSFTNWTRGGQVSGSKDNKISKNSAAFRSIQNTLSQDNNSYGRGRSYNKDHNKWSNNKQSGHISRGRGEFGRSRRTPDLGFWSVDSVRNFDNVDDDEDDEEDDSEYLNKTGRRSDSPTFAAVKKAFQTLDQSSRSAKNITNLVLNTMEPFANDSQKWQIMIDNYLVGYACENGGIYVELAAQLFVRFIDEPTFQKASYIVLMKHIGELMTPRDCTRQERLRFSNLCEFFGKLLISSWPPGWDSCAKECNMVVYAVMNAVHTWLRALEKSTSKKSPSRVEVTEICALSLVSLSNATGRKLWLKWPDLVDQMYSTLKPVIVSNECGLSEEAKLELLDLFVKLNEWPKPVSQSHHRVTTRDCSCQTIEDGSFSFSQWPNTLPTATYPDVSVPPPTGAGLQRPLSFQGNHSGINSNSNESSMRSGINPRSFLNAPFKR